MWSAARCGAGYKTRRRSSTTLQLSPLPDGPPFVMPAAIGPGTKGTSNHPRTLTRARTTLTLTLTLTLIFPYTLTLP